MLTAERQEAERALAEARRLRAVAEQLAAEARAQAAQHAVTARAAELHYTQVLAERTRVAEELASRPHLARALAERRRLAQEQAEAAQQAEVERVARLASIQMDGLPDDLAGRAFGLWSDARAHPVQPRGWSEPYCPLPATSRGWSSPARRPADRLGS